MDDECHCGAPMRGSDHCPVCFCEEHESTCDHVFDPETESDLIPHTGHFSRLGGTWWCDTCDSPYCEQA